MFGLNTAATLGIGLTVYLDDQFSKASSIVRSQLQSLNMDVDDFAQGMRQAEVVGNMITRLGMGIYSFSKDSLGVWADFEDKLNRTRVVAGIKKTDKGYQELQDTASRLALTYGILPDKIAMAEQELAYAGKTVPEIIKMSEAVSLLARATGEPVEGPNGTATMLVNIMQAYGASANQAEMYADIMTSAANRSTIQVKDLAESMRYSADVAVAARIPFKEVASAFATLGNAGIRGSMAGTAYANMLRYLQTGVGMFGTKRQKTALGALGLDRQNLTDAQGHLIGLSKLLTLVADRTRGMQDNDKFSILQGIFGIRGNRGFQNLLNGLVRDSQGHIVSTFDEMAAGIDKDIKNHVTKVTAQEMLQSLLGQQGLLQASWKDFQLHWGKEIAPLAVSLTKHLIGLIQAADHFIQSPFGKWLINFISASGAIEIIVGKLIYNGARFMAYLMTGGLSINKAAQSLIIAASTFQRAALTGSAAIKGSALQMKEGAIMSNINGMTMFRDAKTGRFMGKAGNIEAAEHWLPKALGTAFGMRGARFGIKTLEFLRPMTEFFGWIGRSLGFLKIFGAAIGKVAGWLFGWEGMLLDLVSTLLTGKGLFEWLWEGIKWLGKHLFGLGSDDGKSVSTKERYNPYSNDENKHKGYIDMRGPREREQDRSFQQQHPTNIHITVNPNNSDRAQMKTFNLGVQRDLNNLSLEA